MSLFWFFVFTSPFWYIFYHVARPQRKPCDTSNRINAIRLAWFGASRPGLFEGYVEFKNRLDLFNQCLTHEERFFDVPGFWWLANDELENMRGVGRDDG